MNKVCRQCNQEKDEASFYTNRRICKACKSANDAVTHRKQAENNPGILQRNIDNTNKWRDKNKERYNKYQTTYQMNKYYTNAAFRLSEIIRKHKRRGSGTLSTQDWQDTMMYFNNACAYCGKTENLTMDHVVPISKMGSTEKFNIIPACLSCNTSKHNKEMLVWYSAQLFFDTQRLEVILSFLGGGE